MQIPEKLINFRAYGGVGSLEILGMTDIELPKFEAITDTISGAGIAGEYDSPVIGHFKSMTVKLKWRTFTKFAISLLAPVQQTFDLRASVQTQDPMLGVLTTDPWRVELRGQPKGLEPGKLEPGKPTDATCEIEVAKMIISNAGVPLVEIDKFNMIYRVGGFDYLRGVRVDLGGV